MFKWVRDCYSVLLLMSIVPMSMATIMQSNLLTRLIRLRGGIITVTVYYSFQYKFKSSKEYVIWENLEEASRCSFVVIKKTWLIFLAMMWTIAKMKEALPISKAHLRLDFQSFYLGLVIFAYIYLHDWPQLCRFQSPEQKIGIHISHLIFVASPSIVPDP